MHAVPAQLAHTPFERWARSSGYNTDPAVLPNDLREYADKETQAAFEAWNAGARHVARMIVESTLETPALRERIQDLAKL